MPVPLLIALFLAFGCDAIFPATPVDRASVGPRILEAAGEVAAVGVLALAVSIVVARKVRRDGRPTPEARRVLALGSRVVGAATLGGYAWLLQGVGWAEVVRSGLGLRDAVLVDELLILLPFLLAQVAGWWGSFPAERALRHPDLEVRRPAGAGRSVLLKARQGFGMVLPSALIFTVGQDLVRIARPDAVGDPGVQVALMAAMAALVLAASPAFVRLSWPTSPLPPGPLRDRLERLAARFRFRCTDILVWDTDGLVVNAGVTGALPWFRYVLLTDALIAGMDEREVAAAFGHEVGHVHHRHLAFLGFFLVGSMGAVSLAGDLVYAHALKGLEFASGPRGESLAQGGVIAGLGLAYFALVFGLLSRRFERQADVFGCRAASCDRPDCPPHLDLGGGSAAPAADVPLCPVGIRTFANALTQVARLSETEPSARSWRHGSIARRIAFVEALEGHPEAERRFQLGTLGLKLALALGLVAAMVVAFRTGAIEAVGP